jgi:hypothetical protein
MVDEADDGTAGFLVSLVTVVVAFVVITLVSVPLFGGNWTVAVLLGGFGAVVAAVSARVAGE